MTGPRLSYEDFQRAGSPDLSYAAFAAPKRRAGDKRPLLERIGAGAQTFTDAASFGGVGLLDDAVTAALSRSTLQEKRDERKASKVLFAEEHPKTALGLQIAGTFATPIPGAGALRAGVGAVRAGQGLAAGGRAIGAGTRLSGTFLKASAPGTGGFRIAGRAGAEGALQGALTGVGQNIGTSEDPMGLQHGTMGATIGGVGGAALTGLLRGGQGLGAGYKAFRAQNLGQSALARKDLMGDTDAINYAKAVAEGKAAGGSTRAVREALDSKTIKFYTKQLRGSETFQNADDATLAREAYKLMSEEQGTLISTIGMTAKDRAKAKIRNGDIQLAKERLLRAVEQGEELVVPGRTRVTGPPPPTTREAIERLHAARAEAARREGVNVDRSPFAGRSPAATDVIQQGRFDQFRRTAGELDAQGNVTLGGIKPAELDPSGMTMSRGDAPRAGPQGPPGSPSRTNETSAQQGAREAMERLDAARLARTGAGAPRPDTRITDPQTYVHTRGLMPSLRTALGVMPCLPVNGRPLSARRI